MGYATQRYFDAKISFRYWAMNIEWETLESTPGSAVIILPIKNGKPCLTPSHHWKAEQPGLHEMQCRSALSF
jgi:hypothetical protein